MNVLITGGSGRLGRCLIGELMRHGHAVCALDVARPEGEPCRFVVADLLRYETLPRLVSGFDAVVHLARKRFPYTEKGYDPASGTWKIPDAPDDAETFARNVEMTYNVLAAACDAAVRKIVVGSSLAVYGFYYPLRPSWPEYVPVDEGHPRRPQDPYGLSKLIGEELGESFSRRSGAQVASLRFSGIYTEDHRALLLERKKNPTIRGTGALWSYVDVRDAARACRLALEADFAGCENFNICAPVTLMDSTTPELVGRHLPHGVELREKSNTNWSGYSTRKAREMLGFEASFLFAG
ncbi:MAG TPA: NAD(P)-dependent oxidoreductase [candidate division Zixibacteria bacterium]|nr:NAD(P)-dependent oxidoreductase [candidate division Zixibacteria bacterium]